MRDGQHTNNDMIQEICELWDLENLTQVFQSHPELAPERWREAKLFLLLEIARLTTRANAEELLHQYAAKRVARQSTGKQPSYDKFYKSFRAADGEAVLKALEKDRKASEDKKATQVPPRKSGLTSLKSNKQDMDVDMDGSDEDTDESDGDINSIPPRSVSTRAGPPTASQRQNQSSATRKSIDMVQPGEESFLAYAHLCKSLYKAKEDLDKAEVDLETTTAKTAETDDAIAAFKGELARLETAEKCLGDFKVIFTSLTSNLPSWPLFNTIDSLVTETPLQANITPASLIPRAENSEHKDEVEKVDDLIASTRGKMSVAREARDAAKDQLVELRHRKAKERKAVEAEKEAMRHIRDKLAAFH